MALGALIGAYQEDDEGALRALLPLAGRTMVEYQLRCLAALGASPLVVLVERVPPALAESFDRLRSEGINVVPVSDGHEAASRFEAGSPVLLLGDGIAPDLGDLERIIDQDGSAVLIVPDNEDHAHFERVDGSHRWAGLALVDAAQVGATAAMLGDWDLQSTLLRRAIQSGARFLHARDGEGQGPFLARTADEMAGFDRRLLVASRSTSEDAASRYLLAYVEETATEKLMETRLRPLLLVQFACVLLLFAAFAFTRGWHWAALAAILFATPLDRIAQRLGSLRLRPIGPNNLSRRLLWPLAGLAMVALGWFEFRNGGDWGSLVTALAAIAFAQAYQVEKTELSLPGSDWLFSWRNAAWLALPFAIAGWWNTYLGAAALYAVGSFFYAQHARHRAKRD